MNYMELVDRTGEKSEDWLVFKQVMKFLQSAGTLLNSGLHRMTGQCSRPLGTCFMHSNLFFLSFLVPLGKGGGEN